MKKAFLLLSLSLFFLVKISGQPIIADPLGESYFLTGTELLREGNFKGADSILSLALCSYKNENVYYNRGVARLFQYDTIGFCADISIAANKYFDPESSRLFNSICCSKVDTIYYNKDFKTVSGSKYIYYEVIMNLKYENEIVGIVHHKNVRNKRSNVDFGCTQNIVGVDVNVTDIIAVYQLIDTVKYYYLTPYPVSILNTAKYEKVNERAGEELRKKYDYVKKLYNVDKIRVFFTITFSKTGDILNTEYLGTFPEVTLGEAESDIEKDLLLLIADYPKVYPASFKKEKVNYIISDSIEF